MVASGAQGFVVAQDLDDGGECLRAVIPQDRPDAPPERVIAEAIFPPSRSPFQPTLRILLPTEMLLIDASAHVRLINQLLAACARRTRATAIAPV